MGAITNLTPYDFVVLGLIALLIGRGIWLGLLKQVTGLLALYLGYFVASQYHAKIFPVLRDISENPKVVFLTAYVILFVITYVVVMLLGKGLSYVIQLTIAGWFDRLLGGIVGLAKAFILVVLMHIILGTVLAPENQMLRSCATCDILNDCADLTRAVIRDENVRKSLLQQKPAISVEEMHNYLHPQTSEKEKVSGEGTKSK